jgi:ankyrin repeat protein
MEERPFVAGIDPGLRIWLKMREETRKVRSQSKQFETIPSDFKYKYQAQWNLDLVAAVQNKKLLFPAPINKDVIQLNEFDALLQNHHTSSLSGSISLVLSKAVYQNHLRFLQTVVSLNYPIDSRIDYMGRTMLHVAVLNGDMSKVMYLLEHGADPNIIDYNQNSPLVLSIFPVSGFHQTAISQMLLNCGAAIDHRDKRGQSALFKACIVGNSIAMTMLIKQQADVSMLDGDQKMPIDYAGKVFFSSSFSNGV